MSAALIGNTGGSAVGNNATLTFAHTVAAGSNRLLVVHVGFLLALTGVTYNGVSMTLKQTALSGGQPKVATYYMVNPPTGAHNVVVSSSGNDYMEAGSVDFSNVDQTVPLASNFNVPVPTFAEMTFNLNTNDDYMFVFLKYWDNVQSVVPYAGQTNVYTGSSNGSWKGTCAVKSGTDATVIGYTNFRAYLTSTL